MVCDFVFLTASTDVLKLTEVNTFIFKVLGYIPQIVVASLILIIAAVIADAVYKVITGSAKAVGHSSSYFLVGWPSGRFDYGDFYRARSIASWSRYSNELFRGLMLASRLA